jgi:hypothetical protein
MIALNNYSKGKKYNARIKLIMEIKNYNSKSPNFSGNTQLVDHLQEAEKQNLKLREEILALKRELKMIKSQSNTASDFPS